MVTEADVYVDFFGLRVRVEEEIYND